MRGRPTFKGRALVALVALVAMLGLAGSGGGDAYAWDGVSTRRMSSFADSLRRLDTRVLVRDTVRFEGGCERLFAFGKTVFVDGEVKGDAFVVAKTIEVGSHARIAGTLYAWAASDPVMYRGAEVSDVAFVPFGKNASLPDVDAPLPLEVGSGVFSAEDTVVALGHFSDFGYEG